MTTGDIITASASRNPLVKHKGIILIEDGEILIAHNTPMYRNAFGGNVVVEPVTDFLQDGRKILSIEPSPRTYADICCAVDDCGALQFDTLNFNCEHFVSYAVTCERNSPQLQAWTGLALCSGMAWAFLG